MLLWLGLRECNPPPDHLPGHTTLDLTLARIWRKILGFAERNERRQPAGSARQQLHLGGTHFMNPREIFVQVRYRFHY